MKFTFHIKDANEKIKEATLALLVKENYKDITMRKVAKEADVALGQVTYYYHTKEALLFSVIKEVVTYSIEDFIKKINKSKQKKEIAIKEYLSENLMQDKEMSVLIVNIMNESLFNEKLKNLSSQFFNRVFNYIYSLIEQENPNTSSEKIKESTIKIMDEALLKIIKNAICVY